MSKARVLAKLKWRVFVVKVETGQAVASLDAMIREIWEREFDDLYSCDFLAKVLLREIEECYPDCFVEVKVLGVGFHESASVNNSTGLVADYVSLPD